MWELIKTLAGMGIICLFLWLLVNFLRDMSNDNMYHCAQSKWVRAHVVGIVEINDRDTTWLCDDGVEYHLKPFWGGH